LGLREVEIKDFRTFEKRFGIKLPMSDHGPASGTLHLQPSPADHCTIIVREGPLSPPAVFVGDIFFPPIPGLPKDAIKYLVKSRLFQILINRTKINISTDSAVVESQFLKIDDWIAFLRMLAAFNRGAGTIAIEPSKLPPVSLPINFTLDNRFDPARYDRLIKALECAQRLLKLAGVVEPPVQFSGMADFANDVIGVDKLFSGAPDISPLRFSVEWPDGTPLPDKIDAIYANFISICGVTMAYYAVAEMIVASQTHTINWQSRSIVARKIVAIRDFPAGYQAFIDQAKADTKIDNVMMIEAPKS
jgi:hypothetical protein